MIWAVWRHKASNMAASMTAILNLTSFWANFLKSLHQNKWLAKYFTPRHTYLQLILPFNLVSQLIRNMHFNHFWQTCNNEKQHAQNQPWVVRGCRMWWDLLVHLTSYSLHKWAATWQNQQNDCAPSKDSHQPGHSPSLISVFAVRVNKAWVLSYPLSAQRRLWSDWADARLIWVFTGRTVTLLVLSSRGSNVLSQITFSLFNPFRKKS